MKRIILASKSPRRIEMLSKYINNLTILTPETDEKVNDTDKPQTTVMKIAFEKAKAIYDSGEKGLIISADTIVYLDKILGKPRNYEEGFQMIKSLSGKTHKVFSGFCIWDSETNKKIVDFEETLVLFNELSDDEIISYLNFGEYKDKAGAYGIQGYGEMLVQKINGCYNNVKGLPLSKLNKILKKNFSINLLK